MLTIIRGKLLQKLSPMRTRLKTTSRTSEHMMFIFTPQLLVFARTSEEGPQSFTVVNVLVVDINDHAPEFTQVRSKDIYSMNHEHYPLLSCIHVNKCIMGNSYSVKPASVTLETCILRPSVQYVWRCFMGPCNCETSLDKDVIC